MGIRVLKGGMLTTVQDLGRTGYQSQGFSVSGVMDIRSFKIANLLLDNPENEAVIQSALAKLVRGKTLLVIAHRLSTIADADQIIVVNQGKIEATGTQAELLASCPLYQAMWEAHISVKDDGEVA